MGNREDIALAAQKELARRELERRSSLNKLPVETSKESSVGGLKAFVEGLGQAVTFGHLPQILAAVGPSSERGRKIFESPISDLISGKAFEEAKGLNETPRPYTQVRDIESKKLAESAAAHPMASTSGTLASIAVPTGALSSIGRAAKGATIFEKIRRGALAGAATGALYNPGETPGEISPLQLKERLGGAGIGLATGAAIPAIAGATKGIGQKLKDVGSARAAKQLGAIQKDIRQLGGPEGVRKLGATAIEEGFVGVTPKSTENVLNKVVNANKKVGAVIGELTNEAAAAGAVIDKKILISELSSELLDESIVGDPKLNKYVTKRLKFMLAADEGSPVIDLKSAQDLKTKLADKLRQSGYYKKSAIGNLTEKDIIDKKIHDKLREKLNEQVDKFAATTANPKIQDFRYKYSLLSRMEDLLEQKYAREEGNRLFSPTDYAAILGGGALGGIASDEDPLSGVLKGATLGLTHKGLRQMGPGVFGAGAYKAGKALRSLQAPVERNSPALIELIVKTQREKGNK